MRRVSSKGGAAWVLLRKEARKLSPRLLNGNLETAKLKGRALGD